MSAGATINVNDSANRVTQITQGSSLVTFTYDEANRRTSVTYPNGNRIDYGYDAANQVISLTYRQGTSLMGTLTYGYDARGNRQVQGGSFARTTLPPAVTTASYNANNQQTTFGTNSLTYDLNGNLKTVTDASGTATYTWNVRNQLTGISAPGFAASFQYDALGRRIGKTVQGVTTNFLYDGLNPVQEKNGNTVTANLLTGLGIDEFFTRTDGAGAKSLLHDGLGSTMALDDGTGTLQPQYTYEKKKRGRESLFGTRWVGCGLAVGRKAREKRFLGRLGPDAFAPCLSGRAGPVKNMCRDSGENV